MVREINKIRGQIRNIKRGIKSDKKIVDLLELDIKIIKKDKLKKKSKKRKK